MPPPSTLYQCTCDDAGRMGVPTEDGTGCFEPTLEMVDGKMRATARDFELEVGATGVTYSLSSMAGKLVDVETSAAIRTGTLEEDLSRNSSDLRAAIERLEKDVDSEVERLDLAIRDRTQEVEDEIKTTLGGELRVSFECWRRSGQEERTHRGATSNMPHKYPTRNKSTSRSCVCACASQGL